jgi:hypothetical protein
MAAACGEDGVGIGRADGRPAFSGARGINDGAADALGQPDRLGYSTRAHLVMTCVNFIVTAGSGSV